MKQALQVFMDYAAAFEETFTDDDWSRLTPFFPEGVTYEVRGGPLACKIVGREEVFAGLKKSLDGLDRRCTDRKLELMDGPNIVDTGDGSEVSLGWNVIYQYKEAPKMTLPGRSVFNIANGVIVAMRDEYDDEEMEAVGAWLLEHGEGLDGSYV
jgi:hypothetical protein